MPFVQRVPLKGMGFSPYVIDQIEGTALAAEGTHFIPFGFFRKL
jgi:hypothetical protein